MKKSIFKPLVLAAAVALVALFALFSFNVQTASAADNSEHGKTSFYYEEFNITYDVASDRKIAVREEMTVKFTGTQSTGFMRDIPVNGGELVKNVSVCEVAGGNEIAVTYDVYEYSDERYDYITADIGDRSFKFNTTHTYVLTYDYCLTKAQEGKNVLALNALGAQDRRVESATITVILPDGFISAECVKGVTGSTAKHDFTTSEKDGRTVITAKTSLAHDEGITFGFNFEDGALKTYFDFTPYYFVLGGLALLLLAFAIKFLLFNKDKITPVINYEAPDKMDPMTMGKLIDNVVDTEDVTSMIFYWADKGYLKIDLSDENDPLLIRIVQQLPQSAPAHEKKLYNGLWRGQDTVRTSSLKYKFYTTVDSATKDLNAQVGNKLYDKKSKVVSVIVAALGGLLYGLSALLMGFTISPKILIFVPFVFCLPFSLMVYFFATAVKSRMPKHRNAKTKFNAAPVILIIVIAAFGLGFSMLVSSYILPFAARLLLVLEGFVIAACSTVIISRTPEYVEKLNGITGFADFIAKAEKDQLEKLINENPQFYYHVLPYAQVLGISDVWENKFASIVIPPPQWSVGTTYFEFYMINRVIRSSTRAMRSNLNTRPASSSGGGSGRGGFGGGHVSGGHGGGGSRGR